MAKTDIPKNTSETFMLLATMAVCRPVPKSSCHRLTLGGVTVTMIR